MRTSIQKKAPQFGFQIIFPSDFTVNIGFVHTRTAEQTTMMDF
jgi:hypothetical protein